MANSRATGTNGQHPPVQLRSLRLRDFTVFHDATLEFGPHINCLVGENGTGKTQLLAALRAIIGDPLIEGAPALQRSFWAKLHRLLGWRSIHDAVVVRHDAEECVIECEADETEQKFTLRPESALPWALSSESTTLQGITEVCLIPAKDFLSHYRNFLAWYEERQIDFDESYYDIAKQIAREPLRNPDPRVAELIGLLPGLIGQEGFSMDDKAVYFESGGQRTELPLTALGHRKFALLYFLLRNGSIRPGSILLWDEPDANLNPKLVGALADILLRLARMDVQVFLATHSYVMLKELDLRASTGEVRYHALYRDPEQGGAVNVHSADELAALDPNPILDTYSNLYDRQIARALGQPVEAEN